MPDAVMMSVARSPIRRGSRVRGVMPSGAGA